MESGISIVSACLDHDNTEILVLMKRCRETAHENPGGYGQVSACCLGSVISLKSDFAAAHSMWRKTSNLTHASHARPAIKKTHGSLQRLQVFPEQHEVMASIFLATASFTSQYSRAMEPYALYGQSISPGLPHY